jgi:hypothetical protein
MVEEMWRDRPVRPAGVTAEYRRNARTVIKDVSLGGEFFSHANKGRRRIE